MAVTSVGNWERFPLLGQKEQPLNSPPPSVQKVRHTLDLDISIQLLSGEIHVIEPLVFHLDRITERL